jgi:probable HAF family extracellular repeat protein
MSALIRNPRRLSIILGLLGLAAWGCGDELATAPSFARPSGSGGKGPTVKSTNPEFAARGITLDVRVVGSGFDQGSRAIWALDRDTAFATTKVRTNSTSFVSSNELVANVTIEADASPDLYDVVVVTAGGKKGIGIELFEVTTEIIDLGAGSGSFATAVNDLGHIVGWGGPGSGAFLWEDGSLTDLGVLPGMTSSAAEGINASGQVVGSSSNGSAYRAFVWTAANGMQALPTLGGCCSQAFSINDAGEIVGTSTIAGNEAVTHAVVWRNGVITDIQAPTFATGSSQAWNINNVGEVVGTYSDGSSRSYRWTSADGMVLLRPPSAFGDEAIGINDEGQIVGWGEPAAGGDNQAYVWTDGVFAELGTLGGASSVAMDVNESGQVVGRADTGLQRSGALQHVAFLWTAADGMRSLGLSSGTDYAWAFDINESGWVVGVAWQARGFSQATLWRIQ